MSNHIELERLRAEMDAAYAAARVAWEAAGAADAALEAYAARAAEGEK